MRIVLMFLSVFIASQAYAQSFGQDIVNQVRSQSPMNQVYEIQRQNAVAAPIDNMGGGNYMTSAGPITNMGGGEYMTPSGPATVMPDGSVYMTSPGYR